MTSDITCIIRTNEAQFAQILQNSNF